MRRIAHIGGVDLTPEILERLGQINRSFADVEVIAEKLFEFSRVPKIKTPELVRRGP